MQNEHYVLKSLICDGCIWGKNGFYNQFCAHCPRCHYSKDTKDYFTSRETAEMLGLVKKKEVQDGTD